MTPLTDRYVHEVVRRIPAGQRDDIADELRATIADTVEARGSAEREVLMEMGDPVRLAAGYSGRPLALIGPGLYPAYLRLLKLLLWTVLPLITAASVALDVLDDKDAGAAIGTGIGTVLVVGAQMVAWLTVVFALIDRFPRRAAVKTWTPDDLPDVRDPEKGGLAAGASVAWNVLLIGLIVWQHVAEPFRTESGERTQVLDPALWSGWIWPVLAGLAGLVALEVVRIGVRRWTFPLVAGYVGATAVYALPLAWIVYQKEFFSPAFLADVTVLDSFYTVTALGVLAVSASNVIKAFRAVLG
ncbi:HAAS signaling domain-containing protein [Spirillospora sp. NPDC048911]|uniref:HAAS signaling domain-containing protein n=1 Tax=Spirillospora sp. NPDC048911 TaxID=3364527 RepID=UPI003714FE31